MKLRIVDGVTIVVKHSMDVPTKARRQRVIITLENTLKSGLKGAAGVFVEIIKTAPKIYILIYIKYFLRNIPYLIYRSMPERVKVLFRNIKKKLLRSFANP